MLLRWRSLGRSLSGFNLKLAPSRRFEDVIIALTAIDGVFGLEAGVEA